MADSAPPLAGWRAAGQALAAIEARELIELDTQAAVRQIFGHNRLVQDAAMLPSSGLVDQQFWFMKIAARLKAR